MKGFVRWCGVTLLSIVATATVAAASINYQGLWYAAPAQSEAGWGINFAHQGDIIFATWFTYDSGGKAWWLTMTASKTAEGVYSGALYTTTGAPFSAFVPPATAVQVGTGSVTFASANAGTFAYVVNGIAQTKSIVPQVFGAVPTCAWGEQLDLTQATNFQDLWYASPAESESGWGVNLTQQGTTIFATWFTYDANRNPLWLSATAPQTAANTFSGTLYLTRGPPFNATPFNPAAVVLTPVGTVTFAFTNGNNGTFTYAVDLGDGVNKATQSKAITRQVFRAPGTVCRPDSGGVTTAEGMWRGTTSAGKAIRAVVLDDGTYYIVFSDPGTDDVGGGLQGSSTAVGGVFTSSNARNISFLSSWAGNSALVSGTYVPKSLLQLSVGAPGAAESVTMSYDAAYDRPASLAAVAGTYTGLTGHYDDVLPATATIDAAGNITIRGQCVLAGTVVPRGTVNVFDLTLETKGGLSTICLGGTGRPIYGIMFVDEANGRLRTIAPFSALRPSDMHFGDLIRQ